MNTTPTKRVTRRSTSESSPGASGLSKRPDISPGASRSAEEIDERFRQQPRDIEIGVDGDDFEIETEKKVTQKGPRKFDRDVLFITIFYYYFFFHNSKTRRKNAIDVHLLRNMNTQLWRLHLRINITVYLWNNLPMYLLTTFVLR